jgi:hypothetical protein
MTKNIKKEITWSEGRTRKEIRKQTFWSSSKDYSGLSGFEVSAYDFNHYVICRAITSQGLSYNKNFGIPVDKIEEFCHSLMDAKKIMESKNNEEEKI